MVVIGAIVQALLLSCLFQQNTPLSIASWSYHALAVKASYQLGLHSPTFYEEHRTQRSGLLNRLWFAVVDQDRCLGITLGSPCLIVADHVRIDAPGEHAFSTTIDAEKDQTSYPMSIM
jgi:hypothetical protein